MPSRSPVSTLFRWKAASPDVSRVRPVFWPHAAILQLRHIALRQIEIKVRVGLGCRWRLVGRRRTGAGSPGSVSSTCIV